MAILKRDVKAKMTIDLHGAEGNAFALIARAGSFGRQLGMTKESIEELRSEMMSGDYENLIKVFDREFGDYVDLIR